MILNNSNWQPSIVRSVRGNSSYGFVNQIFEADVDKLKVEIALATKPNQINNQLQILPCILTVTYLENIDDDIFSVPLGLTKPLATLIDNLKPYPFNISLQNPNATAIVGTIKKPKVTRVQLNQNLSTIQFNENKNSNESDVNIVFANGSAMPTIDGNTITVPS